MWRISQRTEILSAEFCGPANEIKLQKLNDHLNQMNAYLTQCVLIIHKRNMWIIHGWVVSRFRNWLKGNLTLRLGVVIIWYDNLKMAKNRLISQLVCHYKNCMLRVPAVCTIPDGFTKCICAWFCDCYCPKPFETVLWIRILMTDVLQYFHSLLHTYKYQRCHCSSVHAFSSYLKYAYQDSAFTIETWSNSLEFNFSDKRISFGAIDLCLATFYSLHVANTHRATCEGKGRD